MAADQRKKRLSSANIYGYGSMEQHRTKKKPLRTLPSDRDWKLSPHTSLQWHDNEKKVVAKVGQVGLLKRDLASLTGSSCHEGNLADVISVPKDIFELDDLGEVLSYEVWKLVLSEKDRRSLVQFLPKGFNPNDIVQNLLDGDNFLFGNPLSKWGFSLCSGDLHPDVVLHQEHSLKDNKKAYYNELQNYHINMIKYLQNLKERCTSSKDPEREIMRITSSRSKRSNAALVASELRSNGMEECVAATSESCSWTTDDKACSSGAQYHYKQNSSEVPRSKGSGKGKELKPFGSSKAISKPSKGEKLHKANINFSDGTKYMSYVKISKAQHELVKSMKQSGNSIQSKALHHVLGNLNNFQVKPYVMFEEEEQSRIHEYWLYLAKKDLPAAFLRGKKTQLDRIQLMKSLCIEIEGKAKLWTEEEETERSDYNSMHCDQDDELPLDPEDNKGDFNESTEDDEEEDDEYGHSSPENQFLPPVPSADVNEKDYPMDLNEEEDNSMDLNEEEDNSMDLNEEEHSPVDYNEEEGSLHDRSEKECNSVDLNETEHNCKDLNEEDSHALFESNDGCSIRTEYHMSSGIGEPSSSMAGCPAIHSPINVESKEIPCSSTRDVWPDIDMLGSSLNPSSSLDYAPCSDLTLKHSQVMEDHSTRLIGLETVDTEGSGTKNLLHQHATSELPFFGSYPNHDPSELLHSLVKRDNYHQPELKKPSVEMNPSTSHLLMESAQFPGQMREQLPSFAQEHHRIRGPGNFFIQQNVQDSMYANNSNNKFSIPRQEQFTPVNMQDWATSSAANFNNPFHPQLAARDLLNHNWTPPMENRAGIWPAPEGSIFTNSNLRSVSSGGDQSLSSVLAQCNPLPPRPVFNSVGPSERFLPVPNFGEEFGGGMPRNSNHLVHYTSSPLDYLGGHDAAPPPHLKNNSMGWMNLPPRYQ